MYLMNYSKTKELIKLVFELKKLEILKDCSSVGIQISKKEVMVSSDIGKQVIKKRNTTSS